MSSGATEPDVATRTEPSHREPADVRRAVLGAAVLLVVVQLGFRAWSLYGAWFHIDDFNFISRMLNEGRSWRAASEPYFGHVMPAGMYLSYLNHVVAPWSWALPATWLLALQALADAGCVLMLVRLFGARPGILPPLCLYLFSAGTIPVLIWWAAGINQLPTQVALFFTVAAHVRYLRTGRLRHAWVVVAWMVFGLVFAEKTILLFGLLPLVTLCWFCHGRGWHRVADLVRRWWPGHLVYVATGSVYVAAYLLVQTGLSPGDRQGFPTLDVVANLVLHAYLPSTVGGPLLWTYIPDQPGSVPTVSDAVMYVSLAVVVLLLREVHRCRTRWARALLLPAFFLVCDIGLVLAGRASYVGALISLDYRYQGELSAVTALALACMTLPLLGAREPVEVRARGELLDRPERIAVVTAVTSCLGLFSAFLYVRHWQDDHQAERYIQRVTRELEPQQGQAGSRTPLVDGPVPPFVTNGLSFPQNLQSRILRGTPGATFPTAATDELSMLTERGRVAPAGVPPVRRAVDVPDDGCGFEVTQRRGSTIELDGPLAYGGWWVRIGYVSTGTSPLTVSTGDVTRRTSVEPGLHALYVKAAGAFDQIRLSGMSGGARLCTDDITVGRPEPVESTP